MRNRFNIQLMVATLLVIAGVSILFMGFWVSPTGIIDSSVLVAFGEISTFAGALFGVDYTHKIRYTINHQKQKEETHEKD